LGQKAERIGVRLASLRREHEDVLNSFKLVRAATEADANSGRVFGLVSGLGDLLEAHFAHENRSLYTPLKLAVQGNPAGPMLAEHAEIARTLKTLLSDLSKRTEPSSVSCGKLGPRIEALQRLVFDHMRKEEKVIFWIAELEL